MHGSFDQVPVKFYDLNCRVLVRAAISFSRYRASGRVRQRVQPFPQNCFCRDQRTTQLFDVMPPMCGTHMELVPSTGKGNPEGSVSEVCRRQLSGLLFRDAIEVMVELK